MPLPEPGRVWLITGGTGQVGRALAAIPPVGVRMILPDRAELDLSNEHFDIATLIADQSVTAIVNCAAYTHVDRAEDEPDLAALVNGAAPERLAKAAAAADIPIVHLSTDYVFSGEKTAPYIEEDRPAPRTVYGRTKLAGEQGIAGSGARHAILRTSWVFSAAGTNFVRTMMRLSRDRDSVDVVADQQGCPTHAGDLAQTISEVTLAMEDGAWRHAIWHVTNAGETTWHGLAQHIFARAAASGCKTAVAHAIDSADFPTRANRPANSRLSSAKLARDFGIALRSWESAVDEVVGRIIETGQAVRP